MCELPVIRFTDEELDLFACAGAKRAVKCIGKNRTPAEGAGHFNDWQYTIEGVLGEAALAKHLGLYPSGVSGLGASDCSGHEVRTSPHHDAPLRMMKRDDDDAPYWFLTGVNGTYTIRGWIFGRDAKRDEWWGTWKRPDHPCYWVPQHALNSPHEPPTPLLRDPEDSEAQPLEEPMITLSIDVTLLDKSRFKTYTRKNGKVAKFCELVLLETPNSEFGDYMVKQGTTKAEREEGLQMPILGNGKDVVSIQRVKDAVREPAPVNRQADVATSEDEDIPF